MSYRDGFDAGERAAFKDRGNGFVREFHDPKTEEQRGFQDGYFPRSSEWSARPPLRDWGWRQRRPDLLEQ